jgi:hypothetical protein
VWTYLSSPSTDVWPGARQEADIFQNVELLECAVQNVLGMRGYHPAELPWAGRGIHQAEDGLRKYEGRYEWNGVQRRMVQCQKARQILRL